MFKVSSPDAEDGLVNDTGNTYFPMDEPFNEPSSLKNLTSFIDMEHAQIKRIARTQIGGRKKGIIAFLASNSDGSEMRICCWIDEGSKEKNHFMSSGSAS
ncbi:uncharacterized protein PHALS_12204 [Plasmopara halstedii]|uniref:Uncharacterized protein n=1 Tax=Plasmopara halstedii TaxID=4781 RepID=A0A0P1ALM3_PLAHL|nr:uncharacterized protein PHALS_12204 [Plasmopara halstedii]CEG41890.1 hypothetical protein PHALS_12204 [Plasmopara halstedii]|eukprot:XP_024578259.1 hypothetical protein PHALS_12204 [Plasmopara halstedii]